MAKATKIIEDCFGDSTLEARVTKKMVAQLQTRFKNIQQHSKQGIAGLNDKIKSMSAAEKTMLVSLNKIIKKQKQKEAAANNKGGGGDGGNEGKEASEDIITEEYDFPSFAQWKEIAAILRGMAPSIPQVRGMVTNLSVAQVKGITARCSRSAIEVRTLYLK